MTAANDEMTQERGPSTFGLQANFAGVQQRLHLFKDSLLSGFGGSEGTLFFKTSFNRQFAKRWVLGLYGQIMAVDFEEDNRGDPNWYRYDANEFGVGANVLFTW